VDLAAASATNGLDRTCPAAFDLAAGRRRSLQLLAGGALFAGTVHAGLCPAHFQESVVFGVFFVVVATLQLVWAGLILVRPSRRLLLAGAIGDLLTVGVWGWSRTLGIPFGPSPWHPEAVGLGDVFTGLVEVAVAVGVFRLVSGRVFARPATSFPKAAPCRTRCGPNDTSGS
jgi:hypothetical protein